MDAEGSHHFLWVVRFNRGQLILLRMLCEPRLVLGVYQEVKKVSRTRKASHLCQPPPPPAHVWATKLGQSPLEEGESESHSLISPRPHLCAPAHLTGTRLACSLRSPELRGMLIVRMQACTPPHFSCAVIFVILLASNLLRLFHKKRGL